MTTSNQHIVTYTNRPRLCTGLWGPTLEDAWKTRKAAETYERHERSVFVFHYSVWFTDLRLSSGQHEVARICQRCLDVFY